MSSWAYSCSLRVSFFLWQPPPAIERCGPTPTLLEWDDHIPSFNEVHKEAKKAEKFLHGHAEELAEVVK